MQRVLVTGATGFLGGAVARDMACRGWQVRATGRNASLGAKLQEEGLEFFPCDLANEKERIASLVAGCQAVVHAAALTDPWGALEKFEAANVTATRHVMEACRAQGVARVVHISSPSVLYHRGVSAPMREDASWVEPPANGYVASKRQAELEVRKAAGEGLNVVTLRPRAIFGPGDTTLLPRILRVASRGFFPLFGGGDPVLDLTWIEDAVHAVNLALTKADCLSGKVYNITSNDAQPRSLVLDALFSARRLQVKRPVVPLSVAMGLAGTLEVLSRVFTGGRWEPPLTQYSVGLLSYGHTLDITAARRELAYKPDTQVLEKLRLIDQTSLPVEGSPLTA